MALQWILRLGISGTFAGHGLAALSVKSSWLPFLTFWGFSIETATQLMRVIGGVDLLVAACVLLKPVRLILLWAVLWAFATALMRPLTGVGLLPFVERSANWAVPLALLLQRGMPKRASEWLQ